MIFIRLFTRSVIANLMVKLKKLSLMHTKKVYWAQKERRINDKLLWRLFCIVDELNLSNPQASLSGFWDGIICKNLESASLIFLKRRQKSPP